jgi:hypothetical protein
MKVPEIRALHGHSLVREWGARSPLPCAKERRPVSHLEETHPTQPSVRWTLLMRLVQGCKGARMRMWHPTIHRAAWMCGAGGMLCTDPNRSQQSPPSFSLHSFTPSKTKKTCPQVCVQIRTSVPVAHPFAYHLRPLPITLPLPFLGVRAQQKTDMNEEMATDTQESAVTAIEKHNGNYEVRVGGGQCVCARGRGGGL